VSSLLTLVLALISVLSADGLVQAYAPRGSPVTDLKVQATTDQIARGQHLASSLCVGCHSVNDSLPLSGGRDVGADLPVPLGSFYSINLTPAGPLKDWSDGEILRVLREGVDRDGHPLVVMSANGVRYLSDDDKQAIIAYLRSQPSVVNVTPNPPDQPSFLAAVMVGAGIVKFQPAVAGVVAAIPEAATPAYGKYVVDYEDCRLCHGEDLTGGTNPNFPKGPNLRVVLGWTQDQLVATLRTGKDPGGHMLSDVMPWKDFARLDDVELGAVYAYLKSLPAQ
jgi:mono/diheme cytochrome c family protein